MVVVVALLVVEWCRSGQHQLDGGLGVGADHVLHGLRPHGLLGVQPGRENGIFGMQGLG